MLGSPVNFEVGRADCDNSLLKLPHRVHNIAKFSFSKLDTVNKELC